jgi:hypothetical protein
MSKKSLQSENCVLYALAIQCVCRCRYHALARAHHSINILPSYVKLYMGHKKTIDEREMLLLGLLFCGVCVCVAIHVHHSQFF